MGIAPIHQRMAELWVINQRRPLMEHEMIELHHCLSANVKLCWEYAELLNYSLMAHMTNDTNWYLEVCAEIEKLKLGDDKTTDRKRKNGNKKRGNNT